jgi:hypothetical protein
MPSHSILRRYTPPTCTLEVMATNSVLSRWAGQPVLQDLRFNLNLDDPKQPQDQWLTVKGDREQLEALCQVVQQYVQQFLGASCDQMDALLSPPPVNSALATLATSNLELTSNFEIAEVHESSEQLAPAANASLTNPIESALGDASTIHEMGIALSPLGLLTHGLHLGQLAPGTPSQVVSLSTLQLFDLANALEAYQTDALSLPTLPNLRPWYGQPTRWAQVAAGVLLAVGVSASAVKLWDGSLSTANVASAPSSTASSRDQQIATQIPPAVAEKAATPPAISTQILPPPPPGSAPITGQPGVSPTVPVPSQPSVGVTPNTGSPGGTGISSSVPGAIASVPVPVPNSPTVIPGEANFAKPAPTSPTDSIAAAPATESGNSDSMTIAKGTAEAPDTSRLRSPATAKPEKATAFDTIPQVAEARSYFQQRWQPPEGLSQDLQYRLIVDSNGGIQSIVPLTQSSGNYVDRTNIPLPGEPFVSPLSGRQAAQIRLVLSPDGKVQTFLE